LTEIIERAQSRFMTVLVQNLEKNGWKDLIKILAGSSPRFLQDWQLSGSQQHSNANVE